MENLLNLDAIGEYFSAEIDKCYTRKQLAQLETVFSHFSAVIMDICYSPYSDDKNKQLYGCFRTINEWFINKRYSF